jgi:hypothetical protein
VELRGAASTATTLGAGRRAYVRFVNSLATSTGTAATELQASGVPAVKDGRRISGTLVRAFTQAHDRLRQEQSQAAAIPTTGAAAYQAAASGLSAALKQTLAAMAGARPEQDPQLRAAADKDAVCRALRSGH